MTRSKRLMSRLIVCAGAALLPAAASAQSPGPSRVQGAATEQQTSDVRFRLPHAIEIAEREGRGRAISAVLTPFATGGGALEVTVMRPDKTVVKYRIDANHGAVVNVTEQTLQSYVSSLDPAALGGLSVTMTQAIAAVEAEAGRDAALGAEVESDDGRLSYEVSVLKDGETRSFAVASDGKVQAQ